MSIPGITTTTTTEVTDYTDLGRFVGHQNSDDQVDVLAGFALEILGDGDVTGPMQVQYIAEALEANAERYVVRWFVSELHARINPEQVAA